MAGAYSTELRSRVLAAVDAGAAPEAAARRFAVGRSTADRWVAAARDEGNATSLQAEMAVLGANHAELGGLIAEHWKLPARIVLGNTFHHSPEAGDDPVCDTVYLANVAAKRIGEGTVLVPAETEPDPAALARLGLATETWEQLMLDLPAAFETTLAQYAWGE